MKCLEHLYVGLLPCSLLLLCRRFGSLRIRSLLVFNGGRMANLVELKFSVTRARCTYLPAQFSCRGAAAFEEGVIPLRDTSSLVNIICE